MEDLYTHTGIEFNLGVTLAMQNKYVLINHITRPDLPVWLAIRMSANLPIIFSPVRDTVFNDFVYDGGHLNNNPIKCYLDSAYTFKKLIVCDASTQTNEPETNPDTNTNTNTNINNKTYDPGAEKSDGNQQTYASNQIIYKMPLKKYKMNFICIDLKINRMQCVQGGNDLDKITLMDYLVSIISKFTYNQDSYKSKYMQYMLSIDCTQFPELLDIPFTASNTKIKEICASGYDIMNHYYESLLCVL